MRRRKETAARSEAAEIDMTPMLDIVFIMLIFFIVSTSFIKESGVSVNRPGAKTAQAQPKGHILVAIKPGGEIWVDKHVVDVRALRPMIERLKADQPESGVVIQADEEARTGLLVKVMDQVRLAGVSDISIAAEPVGR